MQIKISRWHASHLSAGCQHRGWPPAWRLQRVLRIWTPDIKVVAWTLHSLSHPPASGQAPSYLWKKTGNCDLAGGWWSPILFALRSRRLYEWSPYVWTAWGCAAPTCLWWLFLSSVYLDMGVGCYSLCMRVASDAGEAKGGREDSLPSPLMALLLPTQWVGSTPPSPPQDYKCGMLLEHACCLPPYSLAEEEGECRMGPVCHTLWILSLELEDMEKERSLKGENCPSSGVFWKV